MNANLTISEIVTIAVIILIIFGPQRLPEMARRAGELLGKVRSAATTLQSELSGEFEDVTQPLKDIEADLRAAKDDLTATAKDVTDAIPRIDGSQNAAEVVSGASSQAPEPSAEAAEDTTPDGEEAEEA